VVTDLPTEQLLPIVFVMQDYGIQVLDVLLVDIDVLLAQEGNIFASVVNQVLKDRWLLPLAVVIMVIMMME